MARNIPGSISICADNAPENIADAVIAQVIRINCKLLVLNFFTLNLSPFMTNYTNFIIAHYLSNFNKYNDCMYRG